MSFCNICKQPLDMLGNPFSKDCGGDCLLCMAEIVEDPDCIKTIFAICRELRKENSWNKMWSKPFDYPERLG